MDALMKEAGPKLLGVGGLRPSREGAIGHLRGRKISFTDGPFTESKEVIGGFATFELASLDEAKEWTRKFIQLHIDHYPGWDFDVEIRPMDEDV